MNFFDCAAHIFNLTAMRQACLSPTQLKVVNGVGAKNPCYLSGNSKGQVTVLACSCDNGYVILPFDRKTLSPELTKGEIPGTLYGLSANGWIDME